jgi:hypothetical protein
VKVETFGSARSSWRRSRRAARICAAHGSDRALALASLTKLLFISSRSPYGVAWAALKLRQGSRLRDTGNLMNSITWSPGDGERDDRASLRAIEQGRGAAAVRRRRSSRRRASSSRFKVGGRWFFAAQA